MFSRLEKLPQKPFARRDSNEKPNCFDKTRRRVFKHLLQFTVRLTFHYEKRVYDELLDFVSLVRFGNENRRRSDSVYLPKEKMLKIFLAVH